MAVTVNVGRRESGRVEVLLYEPHGTVRLGRGVSTSKHDVYIHQTLPKLVPVVERAMSAAEAWRARMRAPTGSLRLRTFAALFPGDTPRSGGQTAVSFKALQPLLRATLDELLERSSTLTEDVELVIELGRRVPRVHLLEGGRPSAVAQKVPTKLKAPVLSALKPFTSRWEEVLAQESYTIGVRDTRFLEREDDEGVGSSN